MTFLPESAESAAAALPASRARFLADFAAGRIGQHHNLYQHRARLIRQQAARADAPRGPAEPVA